MNGLTSVILAGSTVVAAAETLPIIPGDLWARAPYFASLLFVVVGFAWFLEKRDSRSSAALEARDRELMAYMRSRDAEVTTTLKALNDESHAIQEASIASLKANTEMLGKIAGVLLAVGSVAAERKTG
jgi:hypothetical protein